jgi:quinol-cytochrome oxidoreductase complex cytochrome b subunit
MNDETKKKINARYERELTKGERFWPDSIYKDMIVSLGIFILLVLLATFIGISPEAKADPSDTSYIPRPEWYFLFIFKFLAIYGQIPHARQDRMDRHHRHPWNCGGHSDTSAVH